jgi:hypothetical protein
MIQTDHPITVTGQMGWLDQQPVLFANTIESAGHTLTVFRRERGRWLLARDANMLVTLS